MALLTAQEAADVRTAFWEECSRNREVCALSKDDGLAAVVALDVAIEAVKAQILASFPPAAAAAMNGKQKFRMLRDIVRQKWEIT